MTGIRHIAVADMSSRLRIPTRLPMDISGAGHVGLSILRFRRSQRLMESGGNLLRLTPSHPSYLRPTALRRVSGLNGSPQLRQKRYGPETRLESLKRLCVRIASGLIRSLKWKWVNVRRPMKPLLPCTVY